MRRAVSTAVLTTAGVVVLLSLKPHHSTVLLSVPPVPGASSPGRAAGPPRDGTFTGAAVRTPYGPVRVAAVVRGGRLVAVRVIQVPSGTGRDQQIAGYAVPRLAREAIGADSARIDAVSGASYTSQGYIDSLQSALDRADG
ncbi:FMN-binding protein [Streptomyces sp. SL13]|uniref:FMN-binding protein n=1 Tax=Streptantibioticus silvisoli TaxID=2705255 RepID=A0AA90H2N6_9ACTN|nr:FMN-binding protein [Streptantibioticus silvisoli]MDI5963353.1 FMN-binding protein [Streptantibioticus silvisoli]MDI5967760.1 FMN-binding protein [Streptantibioticus silvisoli]